MQFYIYFLQKQFLLQNLSTDLYINLIMMVISQKSL